jgi:lipoyl-dependent peroxiredoxin
MAPKVKPGGVKNERVERVLANMAERLRRGRLEHGYRLADIAAMCEVSEPFLYRIEQGERLPSLEVLVRLADVYGVEPADLLQEPSPEWSTWHEASAVWEGGEADGAGRMAPATTGVDFDYDLESRMNGSDDRGLSSPEEMIGMALCGCFGMSLAQRMALEGWKPRRVETAAQVELASADGKPAIRQIRLTTRADVPGADAGRFRELAEHTRRSCVVSRALAAVSVTVDAQLT